MMEETQEQLRLESSARNPRERARAIYLALSNEDSLELLSLAATGIVASASSPSRYGISKKRYYLRLKCLVDLDLVQKEGGMYVQSDLGRLVYENHLKSLESTLGNIYTTTDQNSRGLAPSHADATLGSNGGSF